EDGIRDRNVTGVQTCALPICCELEKRTFIHPFNDIDVIAGQGTIAVEVLNDCPKKIDYMFAGIGGGGLISGLGTYLKSVSPKTNLIGVEPAGAPSMKTSIANGEITTINEIDPFVDGAAVKTVGEETFHISKEIVDDIVTVPEGKVCSTLLSLYNENAIVAEP